MPTLLGIFGSVPVSNEKQKVIARISGAKVPLAQVTISVNLAAISVKMRGIGAFFNPQMGIEPTKSIGTSTYPKLVILSGTRPHQVRFGRVRALLSASCKCKHSAKAHKAWTGPGQDDKLGMGAVLSKEYGVFEKAL